MNERTTITGHVKRWEAPRAPQVGERRLHRSLSWGRMTQGALLGSASAEGAGAGRRRSGAAMQCQRAQLPHGLLPSPDSLLLLSLVGGQGLDLLYLQLQSLDASGKGKMFPRARCLTVFQRGLQPALPPLGCCYSQPWCLNVVPERGLDSAHSVGAGALTLAGREDSDQPAEAAGLCREPHGNRAGEAAGPELRWR